MTVEIFIFCSLQLLNQFDIVSETHFNCDTVGRELWLAIGKQGYVFILPDFKK